MKPAISPSASGKEKDEQLAKAEALFKESFNCLGLTAHSIEHQRGALAALIWHFAGIEITENCPYKFGTVEFDAFSAGVRAGRLKYKEYSERQRAQKPGSTKQKLRPGNRLPGMEE